MNEQNDDQLIERTLHGERTAFGQLVQRYQTAVYSVAFNVLRSAPDAEDAAQSAFLKAYENLDSYKPEYKFFSWLYRIAVNESINLRRKKKPLTGVEHAEAVERRTADVAAEENELEDRIGEALMELTPGDRAIIILRHYQDFSYPDIAYIMEITEKKVKSRLYTARQRLRQIFEHRGIRIEA